MTKEPTEPDKPSADESSEYVKGGKGRKDDVRGSRIYPIGAPDAPVSAEVIGAGELGHTKDRLPAKPAVETLVKKSD